MTETLSLAGAKPTLDERFLPGFAFRTGGANPDPISPLGVGTPLDQGYNPWSQQPVGDKPKAATRSLTYPAFTDMGGKTADVAPNADLCARLGVNPITVYPARTPTGTGAVSLRPLKMTPAQKTLVPAGIPGAAGKEYLSPALNTYPFAQKYGVFELLCRLPKDRGLWPAWWFMPASLSRYPELDALEMLGHDPLRLYQTIHLSGTQKLANTFVSKTDLTHGYHTHSVDLGPQFVRVYLDRQLIWEAPTRSAMHVPMYMILNVAVGNKNTWPGPVDPNDHWLSEMLVTNIRAWQRPEYVA